MGSKDSYKCDLTNLLVPLIMLSLNHQNHKQWPKWGHVPYKGTTYFINACTCTRGPIRSSPIAAWIGSDSTYIQIDRIPTADDSDPALSDCPVYI